MATMETSPDMDRLAKQLWALGDPVRLQILKILPTEPTCHDACNVSKIAKRIGLSQPSASHHLRILRQAGIIAYEKKCRDMIYWIDLEAAAEVKVQLGTVLS